MTRTTTDGVTDDRERDEDMSGAGRVLIVDDHPVVRRGLRTMLERESWVSGVLEAATCADAVAVAVTEPVGIVAMDVALPDGDAWRPPGGSSRAARRRWCSCSPWPTTRTW